MRRAFAVIALAALVFALVACGGEEDDGEVVVSAAASLTDVFTEIAAAFESAHAEMTVALNFGSSSELAAQIVEGAPAEVFASANDAQMQAVVNAGLAAEPVTFARNRIVVITPADSDAVQAFRAIAEEGVRLVLAAGDVPVGDYARRAITGADAAGAYGAGFEARVMENLVSEESNVRAVLAKVELGEADAGIVYATDAAVAGDAVRVVDVPDQYAPAVSYPIAAVGDNPPASVEAFVDFVLSADGQAILQRHGFTSPQ